MRLAVLADIHGNYPALQAVLADAAAHDAQDVLVAGDHFTGGPFPAETADLLRARSVLAIQGNTDNRLLAYHTGNGPDAWRTSDQWAAQRWVYERLDSAALDWLAAQPEQTVIHLPGAAPIRMLHGALHSVGNHFALFPPLVYNPTREQIQTTLVQALEKHSHRAALARGFGAQPTLHRRHIRHCV